MLLVLMDEDPEYIGMVSAYVRTTEHIERFEMKSYTSREQGFAFLQQVREPYLLLVTNAFFPLPEWAFQHSRGYLLLLSDSPAVSEVLEFPILFKYQPLHALFAQIIAHYNAYCAGSLLRGRHEAEVIAVYSASGGTGKTVFSLNLAKQSAFLGQDAFYLNLEWLNSASCVLPQTGNDTFARVIYYAKSNPKQLPAKIGQLIHYHPTYKFSYFEPLACIDEADEMTKDDVSAILDAVLSLGSFKRIVIDLDSNLHPRMVSALERCHTLYWLIVDDPQHVSKAEMLLNRLRQKHSLLRPDVLSKARLIVNKHTGTTVHAMDALGLHLAEPLPYIPQWKSLHKADQLLHASDFQDQVMKLLKEEDSGSAVKHGV
ncbi:hypothetical protein [Paenibacillus thalictri]|uniref:ParA family protein n=1 Tax=Paenibacillus thalictri TaxID=2527873 RepID=A0A4V2J4L0_9BACL|nr:hypothetical protein [Paenibacillus thalictri]TBL80241.1 hypothetical protein EYB31_07430 [Paenibacillus thalictri]